MERTIRELIDEFDQLHENGYTDAQKLRWISQLDGKIATDLMQAAPVEIKQNFQYPYPEGLEMIPLIAFPHDDIYMAYLAVKVDFTDGEFGKYQASMAMYNAEYNEFKHWFLTNYDPAQY